MRDPTKVTTRATLGLRLPSTRPPLRRLAWTLGRLQAGRPLRAADLASQFEVDIRTAYRDLEFLRDQLNTPLEYDRAAISWRLTEPTTSLSPITISQGELVALYFAEKVLQQYRNTPYEADLRSAFRKIQTVLPEEVEIRLDHLESYMSLDLGPLPEGDAAVFRDVVRGLGQRRRLMIRYRSLSSDTLLDRKVDPYRLFNQRGDWYLAAWDHRRAAVRDFALHRIKKAVLTEEPFTPQPDFDFKRYMADAFSIEKGGRLANVAIRFAPRQARWIRERRWHRSARVQDRLDGGCVLRMRTRVNSELMRWVMQFGDEAEVVAPMRLRSEVAERLRKALAVYRDEARWRRRPAMKVASGGTSGGIAPVYPTRRGDPNHKRRQTVAGGVDGGPAGERKPLTEGEDRCWISKNSGNF